MIIGVPKEVKDHESRVGVTPAGAKALTEAGHKVLVEHDAGLLSSFADEEFQAVGATTTPTPSRPTSSSRSRSRPSRNISISVKTLPFSLTCTLLRCTT